jgi:predicted outer membrane protein
VRVIYFYHNAGMPLYLLLAYAKAQASDVTPDEKRTLTALAVALKQGKG